MSVVDWKKARVEMGVGINEMSRLTPETVKAFSAMSEAGEKSGVLDAKTRELIAVAIAVQLRCDGCIATYVDGARQAGATREEIAEALTVALSVTSRASLTYATRALDAYATATPGPSAASA